MLNRRINFLLLLMFLSHIAFAADNYRVGDKLYIWAKSGLNVRTGAGTNFEVLMKVDFGDKIMVVEKTEEVYKLLTIKHNSSEKINIKPLYLSGNWVKIATTSGKEGYVIDQYLLSLKPFKVEISKELTILNPNLKPLITDTLYNSPQLIDDGNVSFIGIQLYENGITYTCQSAGISSNEIFYLPRLTLEEAMILLSNTWDKAGVGLLKNDNNEITFTGDLCSYYFKYENGFVKVIINCWSC